MNLIDISCPNCGCKIHVEPPELGKNTMPEQPKMDKLGVKTGETCTDTISRQAAICIASGYCHPANIAKELAKLPPAQPENDWIPVTKKAHPDLPIRVQVQMNNGWIITAYYQDGEWLSVPDCGEALRDEWIEAWRELPEPYKERMEE